MLRKLFVSWLVLLLMGSSVFAYDKIEHVTSAWPLLTIEYRSQSSSVDEVRMKISGTDKTIQPQKIEKKQVYNQQNLLIAVDTSRSLSPEFLSAIKEALSGYVQNAAADSTAILSFNKLVQLHSAFTSDKEQLLNAVKRLRKSDADSALFSTIDFSISLFHQHEGYRTLLVITDGRNADSSGDISSLIDKALVNGVVINVLGLSINGSVSDSLKKLTKGTGGSILEIFNPDKLSSSDISRLGRSSWQLPAYKIVFDLSGVTFSDAGNTECVLTEVAGNEEITSNFIFNVPDSAVAGGKNVNDYIPSASKAVTKLLNNKTYLYSAIGCCVVILLIILLVLLRGKRTKRVKQPALPEQEEFSNFIIEFHA
ncbi:MAG: VWA domain-containing protein, partial [Desulfovibrionaceae bacterium]|nr:VWA domain-containing protein [Desulfovibrionaceae bacterium]